MNIPPARSLLKLAALSVVYFTAAKFGLAFAFVNASATAIWPPTGIALAAFLVLGYDVWPAILVGAFLANLTTQGSAAVSIAIGLGNTLEGLVGAYLINRFANGRQFVARPQDIFLFAGLGAIVSTTVSASVGVTSLALAGLASYADLGSIWLTWWLGDASGDLVVAPVLVLWSRAFRWDWGIRRSLEAVILVAGLAAVAFMVFHGVSADADARHLPLSVLCTPFLTWAAFRFGRRAVATCMFVVSWITIWGTLRGFGPFARSSPNESLLLLQANLAVEAVTMLAVAAVAWQLRQAEFGARQLAVSDSLTDLANYRRLMTVLSEEIRRSQRTKRPFALLILDLDGLKRINDGHGHLAGNRALCRVADVLRSTVRTTDTVARFGGDEFACLLPEATDAGAEHLAKRLGERLASDPERPRLSVSMGWAVYPRDGESAEPLLKTADQAMYAVKVTRKADPLILP